MAVAISLSELRTTVMVHGESSKIIHQKPNGLTQEVHDEPAKAYQPGNSISLKLAEYKSIYNTLFPNPIEENKLRQVELYLIQQGNASVLDEKLHELRRLKALDIWAPVTGSGERVAEKELLRLHRSLWDLPEVAISKLSEINQLRLSNRCSQDENKVFVWKNIEYLGSKYREKGDSQCHRYCFGLLS